MRTRIYQLLDVDGEQFGLLAVEPTDSSTEVNVGAMELAVKTASEEAYEDDCGDSDEVFDVICKTLLEQGYTAERIYVENVYMA